MNLNFLHWGADFCIENLQSLGTKSLLALARAADNDEVEDSDRALLNELLLREIEEFDNCIGRLTREQLDFWHEVVGYQDGTYTTCIDCLKEKTPKHEPFLRYQIGDEPLGCDSCGKAIR